jgi:hypothetical protein
MFLQASDFWTIIHTEEVTGSIPVSPTSVLAGQRPSTIMVGGPLTRFGSELGATDLDHTCSTEVVSPDRAPIG